MIMKEFKGTKGNWEVFKPDHIGAINVSIGENNGFSGYVELWYHCFDGRKQEAEANAELIADAGNTIQKCGYLPSELLEQRDELLKFTCEVFSVCDKLQFPTENDLRKLKEQATELINKINQQ